jgi:hypothetical protein
LALGKQRGHGGTGEAYQTMKLMRYAHPKYLRIGNRRLQPLFQPILLGVFNRDQAPGWDDCIPEGVGLGTGFEGGGVVEQDLFGGDYHRASTRVRAERKQWDVWAPTVWDWAIWFVRGSGRRRGGRREFAVGIDQQAREEEREENEDCEEDSLRYEDSAG